MPAAQDINQERDLLEFVYAAFNRRDIDAILPRMQPRVEWPNGMEGGWVHGHDEVRAYWTRQWKMIDPQVEPVRMQPDDAGRVIVDVHQVIRDLSGNLKMDRMVQHVYTFSNGLIERMDIRE